MRRLHVLLGVQSLLLILATVNRLWSATDVEVLQGSLRVVDVVNLLVLAPATALVLYLLLEHVLGEVPGRARRALRVAFVAALYLFALSYGMHEPADFIHARFCGGREVSALCRAVAYHDDGLSHGLFFAGLAGIDAVLLLAQAATTTMGVVVRARDLALVLANASVVAAAIVANLGFEAIGLDLVMVAGVAGLSLFLLRRSGGRALIAYFAWAYLAGLAGTVAAQAG